MSGERGGVHHVQRDGKVFPHAKAYTMAGLFVFKAV